MHKSTSLTRYASIGSWREASGKKMSKRGSINTALMSRRVVAFSSLWYNKIRGFFCLFFWRTLTDVHTSLSFSETFAETFWLFGKFFFCFIVFFFFGCRLSHFSSLDVTDIVLHTASCCAGVKCSKHSRKPRQFCLRLAKFGGEGKKGGMQNAAELT